MGRNLAERKQSKMFMCSVRYPVLQQKRHAHGIMFCLQDSILPFLCSIRVTWQRTCCVINIIFEFIAHLPYNLRTLDNSNLIPFFWHEKTYEFRRVHLRIYAKITMCFTNDISKEFLITAIMISKVPYPLNKQGWSSWL